jgi:hypothetical protein
MAKRERREGKTRIDYGGAVEILEDALAGTTRTEILDHALQSGNLGEALRGLRNAIRSHTFDAAGDRLRLEGIVSRFDRRTREDGFHVLHEWDGEKFVDDSIPVMMVDYFARANKAVRPGRWCLAILLDYYFLYLLALFLMRVWDEEDPSAELERITRLLGHLQGPNGSGFRFVEDAETLLWIAISHYEPDDYAYHRLLDKVRGLDEARQTRIALVGAAVLGDHLRWGFPFYYERDLGLMRADNVSDYPWLLYSVLKLLQAYEADGVDGPGGPEREHRIVALLNGLTPDARAFTESPPSSLVPFAEDHRQCRELLTRHGAALARAFEPLRPEPGRYSPIAFQFNFPHNVLIPMVTLALVQGVDPGLNMGFNTLLTGAAGEPGDVEPERLARTLMAYAGYSPEQRRGRRTLMITYDPNAAVSSYTRTLNALADVADEAAASGHAS